MHTDPALKMYEAMAIAEEKDAEIDILKKERAELLELMKRIGNGRRSTASPSPISPSYNINDGEMNTPTTISKLVSGIQLAFSDYFAWFYKPHWAVYDRQMSTIFDSNNVRRELLGYGFILIVILLLCTSLAPLLVNLICIVYPLLATLTILRGSFDIVEGRRLLLYWAFFAALSLCDYKFVSTLYWLLKVLLCIYLYLPQTQGAVIVYSGVICPMLHFLEYRNKYD